MTLDFSSQLHYVWALLPEIVLCVWGMGVLVVGVVPSPLITAAEKAADVFS